MKLPIFCTISGRPAKAIRKWIFGFDIMVMNMQTGEFESNHRFMTDVLDGGSEVDYYEKAEFDRIVEEMQSEIRGRAQ